MLLLLLLDWSHRLSLRWLRCTSGHLHRESGYLFTAISNVYRIIAGNRQRVIHRESLVTIVKKLHCGHLTPLFIFDGDFYLSDSSFSAINVEESWLSNGHIGTLNTRTESFHFTRIDGCGGIHSERTVWNSDATIVNLNHMFTG